MLQARRAFMRTLAAAAAVPAALTTPAARAAEFTFRLGHDVADTHPLHVRLSEAAARIRAETSGRFELQIFPNSQLGGDTDMLGQVRSGALQMALLPELIVGTLVPVASISGIGFAFAGYDDVWKAMDGDLGAHIRAAINKAGLEVMDRIWDNGFRQMTSNAKPIVSPDDLKGLKIRVPASQLWVSMFKAFAAAPTALNASELYSALQTHVVDAQENPLSNIFTQKTFEVQKYCSFTNHMWSGYWPLANRAMWTGVPADIRQVVARNLNQSALDQRKDIEKLNATLEKTLTEKGLAFNRPALPPFRAELSKAGFYAEWKKKFGDESWALLAKSANGLG